MSNVKLPLSELKQAAGVSAASIRAAANATTATNMTDFTFADVYLEYIKGPNTFRYEKGSKVSYYTWKKGFTRVITGEEFTIKATFTGCKSQFHKILNRAGSITWTDNNPYVSFVRQTVNATPGQTTHTVQAVFRSHYRGNSTICLGGVSSTLTEVTMKLNDFTYNEDLVGAPGIQVDIDLEAGPGPEIPSLRVVAVSTAPKPCRGAAPKCKGATVSLEWTSPYDIGALSIYVNDKLVTSIPARKQKGEKGTVVLGAGDIFEAGTTYIIKSIDEGNKCVSTPLTVTIPGYV